MSATRDAKYRCITERDSPYGYWWRYIHASGEPEDTWLAATGIAASVAEKHARETGKTYVVAVSREPQAAYAFACDHPDARNPVLHTALEITPAGEVQV
jgi:hypothetical protein